MAQTRIVLGLKLLLVMAMLCVQVEADPVVVDDFFGTKVADPHRWLEDLDSPQTQNFVNSHRKKTAEFLNRVPFRSAIQKHMEDAWNFPRHWPPMKIQNRYFSFKNSGLQPQNVMYVQQSLQGPANIFFDPNTLSPDGTTALDTFAFSGDGRIFAYSLQEKGQDWKIVKFRNAVTGQDLEDVLENSKWPNLLWSPDNKGVFYSRFPFRQRGNLKQLTFNDKLYYHRIGTRQDEDILIAEFPDMPDLEMSSAISTCQNYLLISGSRNFNTSSLYIASLKDGINEKLKSRIVRIFPNDALYEYITNTGPSFSIRTNKDAPNRKLVTVVIDLDAVDTGSAPKDRLALQWSTFLAEQENRVLDLVTPIDSDRFLVRYIQDFRHALELRSAKDASLLYTFGFPAEGAVTDFSSGSLGDNSTELFVKVESFLNPGAIHRCLIDSNVVCTVFKQDRMRTIDTRMYQMDVVRATGKDGTAVPILVVHKKGLVVDGSNPTLLYGYGGFNVVMLPRFFAEYVAFMHGFNGIYALALLRGEGEFGEKWHEDGMLLRKQNSFDDFESAAEFLIQQRYTSTRKLAIQGMSNGGLLVGACVNQRPELYGAAISQHGVMDILRFQHFTVGYTWCSENGCSDNKTYFPTLLSYSPLHNLRVPKERTVQYPAILVTTGDHDDRVVPLHSYKYMAELERVIGRNPEQTNPILLRVDTNIGHQDGQPTYKRINEAADIQTFIAANLKLEFLGSRYSALGQGTA